MGQTFAGRSGSAPWSVDGDDERRVEQVVTLRFPCGKRVVACIVHSVQPDVPVFRARSLSAQGKLVLWRSARGGTSG